jgi:D-glycero-D-manno-heptose 1,7-bisphosphate phosphatase
LPSLRGVCHNRNHDMKRPAIFFDRDNTLIVSDEYLADPAKVVIVEGAAEAVARARKLGFATVVFSNQSGVARGMFDEDAVRAVNARLDELLKQQNPHAIIDRHEFCPYHPQATVEEYRRESDLRKPSPGMIYTAAHALALDLDRSWVLGDAPRDIEAGAAAGCRTILLRLPNLPESPAAQEPLKVQPEKTVTSLKDALDYIASDPQPPPPSPCAQGEGGGEGSSGSVGARPSPPPSPGDPGEGGKSSVKLELLAEEILRELRRQAQHAEPEFSVASLLGVIAQFVAIAIVFLAYLNRADARLLSGMLLFAIWLQVLTIALMVMGRHR